jgi:hypothetical protein
MGAAVLPVPGSCPERMGRSYCQLTQQVNMLYLINLGGHRATQTQEETDGFN